MTPEQAQQLIDSVKSLSLSISITLSAIVIVLIGIGLAIERASKDRR